MSLTNFIKQKALGTIRFPRKIWRNLKTLPLPQVLKRRLPARQFYVGLVGTGGFVKYAYVPALNAPQNPLVVSGIFSRTAESSRAVQGMLRYKTDVFPTFASLAASGVRAIILATPHHLHYEYIVQALDLGLDVFCEKPLVNNLKEARALKERLEGSKQIVMVGFNQRYLKRFEILKTLLENKEIGEIQRVSAYHNQNIRELLLKSDWMSDSAKSGGGVVHNSAIHLINIMQYLLGPIDVIRAECKNLATPVEFGEDTAFLRFDFTSGIVGSLNASYVGAVDSSYEHVVIDGDNGQIQTDMLKGQIAIFDRSGQKIRVIRCRESISDSVRNEFSHFFECVRDRCVPNTNINDFIETLRVTEAARLAAKEKREVRIAEVNI